MTWQYRIIALDRPRVQSRVMQVFDHQLITIKHLTSLQLGSEILMHCSVVVEESKGARMKALLLRLQEVRSVSATCGAEQATTAATICRANCNRSGQQSLLPALASLNAVILGLDATGLEFEIVGSEAERAEIYDLLKGYWAIERVRCGLV